MFAMREEVDRVFHRARNDSIIVAENGSSSKKEEKVYKVCKVRKVEGRQVFKSKVGGRAKEAASYKQISCYC
jgi:hypothetical protein